MSSLYKKNRKWWGKYRDPSTGTVKRVPLCRDKQAAQTMLNDLEIKAERRAVGRIDGFDDHAKRPLAEHLADYKRYLTAKGNTQSHVEKTHGRIKALLDGCRFVRLSDLSASRAANWLAEERKADRLSITTSNYYLTAVKGLCNWLVRDRRWPMNPLAHLKPLNAEAEEGRERRALSDDEFTRLVNAARANADTFRGLAGADRAMLYIVAANTGLRASELASLTAASFDLTANVPTVTVAAAYSKRRRRDVQPLRADVAVMLAEYLAARQQAPDASTLPMPSAKPDDAKAEQSATDARLWHGTWHTRAAEMIRLDLQAARAKWLKEAERDLREVQRRERTDFLAYADAAGRVFDFHALRHHFISGLAAAGVHPKLAQTLARHSTITLTMDRYAHVGVADVAVPWKACRPCPLLRPRPRPRQSWQPGRTPPATCNDRRWKRWKKTVPTAVPTVPKMVPYCMHDCRCNLHVVAT